MFPSEFLFENEFSDEVAPVAEKTLEKEKDRDVDKSKSKTKEPKMKKEPAAASTGRGFTNDLIGLDLSRPDDSDDLLLELASLDLDCNEASSLLIPNQEKETFHANFDQVFGSEKPADSDWNNFLPSQLLTNSLFESIQSPSNDFNALSSSADASLNDVNQKKVDVTSKKVNHRNHRDNWMSKVKRKCEKGLIIM